MSSIYIGTNSKIEKLSQGIISMITWIIILVSLAMLRRSSSRTLSMKIWSIMFSWTAKKCVTSSYNTIYRALINLLSITLPQNVKIHSLYLPLVQWIKILRLTLTCFLLSYLAFCTDCSLQQFNSFQSTSSNPTANGCWNKNCCT